MLDILMFDYFNNHSGCHDANRLLVTPHSRRSSNCYINIPLVLIPLQDAITQCQGHPPSNWSEKLLHLVDRDDVGSVLSPADGSRTRAAASTVRFYPLVSR